MKVSSTNTFSREGKSKKRQYKKPQSTTQKSFQDILKSKLYELQQEDDYGKDK